MIAHKPLTSLLAEARPPAVGAADPPRGPSTHRLTSDFGFVEEGPVPELRILTMGDEQSIRALRLGPVRSAEVTALLRHR